MNGQTLREGIFALRTRRFGTVAELMIKRLDKLGKGKNQFHDLYNDLDEKRVEVKFSTVMKGAEGTVTEENVLRCIEEAIAANRMVIFPEWKNFSFDCNIQQVKKVEFDVLYYGLFFADCVKIFRIMSEQIGSQIFYSDKQHKGNVGEGQFHINGDTFQIHLDNYLYQTLTYEELYELLK